MYLSAKNRIDKFFEACQRNIETLSPKKVREKQSSYLDEEKKIYFAKKLENFLSDNPIFAKKFNKGRKTSTPRQPILETQVQPLCENKVEKMITLDSTWCGIRELKQDVKASMLKYGFAHSFRPIDADKNIYDCIVSDEDEGKYFRCQLSFSDVMDIVNDYPVINEPFLEKQSIGNLLYLIYLYGDLYEDFDLQDAESFDDSEWQYDDRPLKGSMEDDHVPNRKFLKMSFRTAKRILDILKENQVLRYDIIPASKIMSYEMRADIRNTNNIIYKCEDILKNHGMRLPEFMSRIKQSKDGTIYWKTKKYYHILN